MPKDKLKIGILTFHYAENRNYGAILQLFASYTIIARLGYTPVVINYIFKKKNKSLKNKILNWLTYPISTKKFANFSNAYLPNKTIPVDHFNLANLNKSLDGFVVGSDQVWRYSYVPNISDFFLSFVYDELPKISYAASFGVDHIEPMPEHLYEEIKLSVKKFKAVSVREISGIDNCRQLGVDAKLVLDPVFLLSADDYVKKLGLEEYIGPSFIAKMLLDNERVSDTNLQHLKTHLRLPLTDLKESLRFLGSSHLRSYRTVNEWLSLLRSAEVVVTDSFHCIAFSIIFRKKFVCLANKKRGLARLESLLGLLGLEQLIVESEVSADEMLTRVAQVNYDSVHARLDELRNSSFDFLQTSLPNK